MAFCVCSCVSYIHENIPYLQRPQVPVQTFTIMPQSPTLLRIAYQGMYCLELRLRGGGLVSLRDGAYSRFDRSNVVDEFTPTQGLKVPLIIFIHYYNIVREWLMAIGYFVLG